MTQRPATSLLEVCLNVGSGFVLSLLVWEYVIEPLFSVEKNLLENIGITGVFTVVSIARGYIFRRLFTRIGCSSLMNRRTK